MRGELQPKPEHFMETLRVLLLEDDALDAKLVLECLSDAGVAHQVASEADFKRALDEGAWDLILSDYSLPGFDGMSALRMARACCPDVPFIFVSGALGEERAIESLKTGATDYVLKNRLERLPLSVHRAPRSSRAMGAKTRRRRFAISGPGKRNIGLLARLSRDAFSTGATRRAASGRRLHCRFA